MDSIKEHLQHLYPDCWEELEQRIGALTESWKLKMGNTSGEALYPWVSKDDVMLITYGAVSYTHLDVYKRQHLQRLHFPTPWK